MENKRKQSTSPTMPVPEFPSDTLLLLYDQGTEKNINITKENSFTLNGNSAINKYMTPTLTRRKKEEKSFRRLKFSNLGPPLRVKLSANEIIEEITEKEENEAPPQQTILVSIKDEATGKENILPPIIQQVSTNAPNSNKSGKIFKVNSNEFQLLHLIGRGGTSKVYKVQHENGQIYALKKVIFTPGDQSSYSCYINEVNLLRKLANRESIVRLYDADINCEKGYLLMLMECGEKDLANVLSQSRNNNSLNLEQIKIYWKQPANFIIVNGSLKLIDFGIAKIIALDKTSVHTRSQIGTPNYMSPEALCGISGTSGAKTIKDLHVMYGP
ncbi:4734_t:CDS:10 [Ambispora gerdemannii]|uniref:4734_t:CDS:1 n=1 Tax=Ambispora gerdemannii TaxID=144530 RepID=A0A9N8YIJ9_9GLOM|nr:4734_t:CDS:10 [Ambispora gerdemannii]